MPQAAPALTFRNTSGTHLTLADFSAHTLLVNLWATWCGPCVLEIPSFDALAATLKPAGILVLPVSIDLAGAAAVTPFYLRHNLTNLPILLDPDGNNMDVLGTDGIPITLVINPEGQLVAHLQGAANWNTPATIKYLKSLAAAPAESPKSVMRL